MRFYEILLEYKQDITVKNFGEKLAAHLKSFENKTLDPVNVVATIEKADPTPNKQYMMWLIKQYMNKQFRLEDASRINQVINTYHKAKPRLPVDKKDINKFTFYQLDDLVDSWTEVDVNTSTETETTKFKNKDITVLYDGPLGFLAIPETEEASCELGRGTKWCTAATENNMFNEYDQDGPLYVFIERPGNKKYQFHFESTQFMDDKDQEISSEKLNYFRTKHPITKKLFAMNEKEIASDAVAAYYYARNVIQGRWPEVEKIIAGDSEAAYYYAARVIDGRWPAGEKAIAKDPIRASQYARDVIKGRWPEGEKIIASNPGYAYVYADHVIKDRWPEAESVIASNPGYASRYAQAFDLTYDEKNQRFIEK